MGFYEYVNYVVYDNPVSKTVTSAIVNLPRQIAGSSPAPTVTIINEMKPLWKQAAEAGPWVRVAGVMGAAAVAVGAYGAHRTYPKDRADELKPIYETGNRYHFFNSLALFGVPFCRNPIVSGSLLIVGTSLFSGACYYRAFTGDDKFGKLAPVGGTILIIAWLSLAL